MLEDSRHTSSSRQHLVGYWSIIFKGVSYSNIAIARVVRVGRKDTVFPFLDVLIFHSFFESRLRHVHDVHFTWKDVLEGSTILDFGHS